MESRHISSHTKNFAIGLILAFALGGAAVAGVNQVGHQLAAKNPPATLKLADANEGPAKVTFAPIVKRTLPAVVNISSSKVVKAQRGGQMPMDQLFQQFFGEQGGQFNIPKERREQSLGSGVIISPEGYILTNNHVVDSATDVRVTLGDKREFKARIVGTDAKTDVAVLKIEASDLPVMTIGDSSKVQVGDTALAMGNPFGVGQTVTQGIISAMGRAGLGIEDYEDFLQTDAPINPGNSGGALINDRGELIGINTAIVTGGGSSEGSHGIGFAVPVNLARSVMDQILRNGKVTRAYLGVMVQPVTPAIAKSFGTHGLGGALVGDVSPDGPAQKAGLEKGDIILDLNGKPVVDNNTLRNNISMMEPGAVVKLRLLRNGSERDLTVKLAEYPADEKEAKLEKPGDDGSAEGISVENLDAQLRHQAGVPAGTAGVVVTEVSPASPAAAAGLRPGDVIQEVNRKPVTNTSEFKQAMTKAGDEPVLLVNRHGTTLFVAV
jgi:serine protease Do